MSGVAEMVTCALCGTKMSADTQYCPKCGSLNAHYAFHSSPGAMKEATAESAVAVAAVPSNVEVTALGQEREEEVHREKRHSRVVRVAAPVELQQRPVDDPDVELPTAWRDGLVRIPPRAVHLRRAYTGYRNPEAAQALEMFGFIGVMGIGHIYGGRALRGLVLMVGWWVVLATVVLPFLPSLTVFTLITTILVICTGPTFSGYWISNELKQEIRIGRR